MRGTFLPDFSITGITPEGTAFGMYDGIRVMVEKAIPGDIADIQMIKSYKDKTVAQGRILTLKQSAAPRLQSFCKHFNYCGGCQWQNLPYEEQLLQKQKQVETTLFSFLPSDKVPSGYFLPPIPSPEQRYYRNRITFTFSNRRWMSPEELADISLPKTPAAGFALKGKNDRVMQIAECYLINEFAVTLIK